MVHDADLKRRVDALRRPLELAAQDNFAGVRKVSGLGHVLRIACDSVLAIHAIEGLAAWRASIDRWEQLDETQQAVEVARGMRLLARVPRPASTAVDRTRVREQSPARIVERATARAVPVPPPSDGPDVDARSRAKAGMSDVDARSRAKAGTPDIDARSRANAARTDLDARAVARADIGPRAPRGDGLNSAGNRTSAGGGHRRNQDDDDNRSPRAERDDGGDRRNQDVHGLSPRGDIDGPSPRADIDGRSPRADRDGHRRNQDVDGRVLRADIDGRSPRADIDGRSPRADIDGGSPRADIDPRAAASDTAGRSRAKPGAAASDIDARSTDVDARSRAKAGATPSSDTDARSRAKAGATPVSNIDGRAQSKAGAAASDSDNRGRAKPAAPDVDPLAAPTESLPGIGPAFAERLAEKGLVTVEDLLWTLPRRYDDVRDARPLAEVMDLAEGQRATFSAKVASSRMVFVRGRRWAEVRLGGIDLTDRSNCVVRWFNVWSGIEKRMPAGAQVVLSGMVKRRNGRVEFANPDILGIEIAEQGGAKKELPKILPRYPDVAGVPGSRLRQACATACARVAGIADDGVPAHVEQAAKMPSIGETLEKLHMPPSEISVEELAAMNRRDSRWHRRLAFGELFSLGIAVALRRRERRSDRAVACERIERDEVDAALPFSMTNAQRRCVDEIAKDLASTVPMNRLLQGDVGAGKTAVAFAAAVQVARGGRQTAVMAPTELLAEQHASTWRTWCAKTGMRVELLTASTPKGVRASLLALLAAGQVDVLIGTHALLSEGVGFHALGLVVIDEQHRFGVAQRAKLRDKGDGQGAPHLLVMTATPIPRTLALTAYGDLDTSVLDELPPGRKPIVTRIMTGARGAKAAYKMIAERIALGERAYVVCPKVEPGGAPGAEGETDTSKWKDATSIADELSAMFPRVGLVHGRLDGGERDRVMRAFKAGEIDVLVATTVIEVGVDVPEATVMVIHDADRFGLAQLHQLRGRVGRGGTAAQCLLVVQASSSSEDAEKRLATMVATTDGFRIAEEDLALRGAGELLGARQAGAPRLAYGNLHQHTELLLEARMHADTVLDGDPGLVRPENAALRRALDRRIAHEVYGAESG